MKTFKHIMRQFFAIADDVARMFSFAPARAWISGPSPANFPCSSIGQDGAKPSLKLFPTRPASIRRSAFPHGVAAFTLVEVLVAALIFALVSSGVIYGYVQSNRMAEWSAISQAAQACAIQGAEQARAADWRPHDFPLTTNYLGAADERSAPYQSTTNVILNIPGSGSAASNNLVVSMTVSITNILLNPPLRQIRADVMGTLYPGGKAYTNTVILLRAPDQ